MNPAVSVSIWSLGRARVDLRNKIVCGVIFDSVSVGTHDVVHSNSQPPELFSVSALITFPKAESDKLICAPSKLPFRTTFLGIQIDQQISTGKSTTFLQAISCGTSHWFITSIQQMIDWFGWFGWFGLV